MVCVYCHSKTQVVNSRPQRKSNNTWRRRECKKCGGIFTTRESVEMSSAVVVKDKLNHLEPFFREKLWLSIHDSVGHRKSPLSDATALTETIISKLLPHIEHAELDISTITTITLGVLKHFDTAADSYYQAYHVPA